ncbi:MAG: DNA-binding NtrC family response regulator [Yoonia sp.]|jgi:DNA-binding NtrC family response regulator
MIHVLTQDRIAKSQLSFILRELGQDTTFYTEVDPLIDTDLPTLNSDAILIDLQVALPTDTLSQLKEAHPELRLIGFQNHSSVDAELHITKPEELNQFFLLPAHAERAKARIKSALQDNSTKKSQNKRSTKRNSYTQSPFTRATTSAHKRLNLPTKQTTRAQEPSTTTRYVTARSYIASELIQSIKEAAKRHTAIILNGNEGAEFEIVAREVNYQANADRHNMCVIENDEISLDTLETIERNANRNKELSFCYLGTVDDLTEESMQAIQLFIQHLEHLRNPHLRLILAYENGCEYLLRNRVSDIFKSIKKRFDPLTIPDLSERSEDISPICLNLLSALRTAHPFLRVKSISDTGIDYLIQTRHTLNYARLIRILRNSIALSQRSSISPEDFKNYGESETTTQHLLESMADEQFFPSSEAVNT